MAYVRGWQATVWCVVFAVGCRARAREADPARAVVALGVPAASGAMAPYLRDDGDGVLASWIEPVAAGGHRLQVARWSPTAWTQPATVVESAELIASWADVPSVARAGDGALVASWSESSAGKQEAYDALVARSKDGGKTWTRLGALHADRTPAEHGFVSMVADGAALRAFWLDGRDLAHTGGATGLRTALVGDAIGGEALVDDRVCDCCATAAVGTDAGPTVAFRDRSEAEVRDIAVARAGGGAWSSAPVGSDRWEISGCPVNGPAAAARGRAMAVAWYTRAHDVPRIHVAFSADAGATFGPAVAIDEPAGDRAPTGRVGVVLDDDGTALVSWVAAERADASLLVRRVAADRRLGVELAIARVASGRQGMFPRIARGDRELLAIWSEPATSRLQAARLLLAAVPAVAR